MGGLQEGLQQELETPMKTLKKERACQILQMLNSLAQIIWIVTSFFRDIYYKLRKTR